MISHPFASYIRAAAELRRWLLPRRRDRQLILRKGTLLHDVDTDVVKLYTNPWEEAPHTERRKEGYAEVFPGEDKEIVVGLGAALAKCIFHGLNGEIPLLMLPPMGEELRDVFVGVARNAEHEADKMLEGVNEIRSLVRKASDLDDPEAVKHLATHADQITRFLLGQEGYTAELRRFGSLLRNTHIAPPEYLIDQNVISDPLWRTALEPPESLADRIRFHTLREKWFIELRKTKSPSHQNVLTDGDAQMLARLEWINDKLTPTEQGAKAMHRLVLITGDQAMHAAAAGVRPWRRSTLSFGELFLRHPKAYLAEPGVLDPSVNSEPQSMVSNGDTHFDQWLDTWLWKLDPGTDDFEKGLENLLNMSDAQLAHSVASLIEARPNLETEVRRTWSLYTRNLILERHQSPLVIQLAGAKRREAIQEYSELIDRLDSTIAEQIRETWEDCFSIVATGSASSLLLARSKTANKMRSRNPPLLTFHSFDATRTFVEKVLCSFEAGSLNTSEWDEALEQVKKDDNSGYAFFLGLGELFAADGIWRVAAILANRALAIAKREHPYHISGREAAYLCAVALRHSARRVEDLEPVGPMLDSAESGYKQDREDRQELKAGPCRFKAERLALYLTYHLYRVMLRAVIPESVPTLEQVQTDIEQALSQLRTSQERSNVRLYSERNLLVNWCMTIFLRFKEEDIPIPKDSLSKQFQALEVNISKTKDEFRPSYYVKAILGICRLILAADATARRSARKELDSLLHPREIDAHSVMRYDFERFAFLRELAST